MVQLDLSVLYSSSSSYSASGGSALSALQRAEKNQASGIAAEAKQPQVQRDVLAFRKAVASAKDVNALLSNPAVMKVLLTANGLGDQTGFPALAKKALLSDPSDANSLVNKLTDTRWKSAASTYNFATTGLATIQNSKVLDTLANGYAEVKWRQSLDDATPGLSNALAWREQASSVTSALGVLGNSTLREVVTTALGIPAQIAYQSLDAQEKAVNGRLNISKLSDPKYVEKIAQQYLVARSASSSSSSGDLFTLATQSRGLVV